MSTANAPAPALGPTNPTPGNAPFWTATAVGAALTLGLFATNARALVTLWERDQNYSHGYLVAAISLAFAVAAARRAGLPARGELGWGLTGLALGLVAQVAFVVLRWPIFSYAALVLVLRGLLVCAGGRAWAAHFNFPLVYLFFMFPLPVKWTGYAALWLQDVVSRVSETALSLFVVCHRVGHTLRIAGVDRSLIVAEECSGLGQIVSFVAFAVLLGQFMARPMWYRAALVLAAVPVAIAANTLRVVLMNLGAVWFGTKWMSGTLHDAPALFSLPVGILLFLLVDRTLGGLIGDRATPAAAPAPAQEPTATPEPPAAPAPAAPVPRQVVRALAGGCAVVAVALAAQFAVSSHLNAAGPNSYPELVQPLAALPLEVTDPQTGEPLWVGTELTQSRDDLRKKLPFQVDDLLVRTYKHRTGAMAHLYLVHSKAGEDRKHHPEICIRDVSGAPEDLAFRRAVPLGGDGAAQRFRFQTGAGRATVVYYWHYTLRPVPDPGRTGLQALHQRLGVSAPSATAQVTLGTDDPAALAAVEGQLLPALSAAARTGVFPAGTEVGSQRVPIALSRTR